MVGVEGAVDDSVVVQCGEERPELLEPWTCVGAGEDSRRRVGSGVEPAGLDEQRAVAAQHQHCVVGGGGSRGHDCIGGDAGLRGEQCHQCLVFDLTEAAEPDGRAGAAQPDRAPHRRHQCGVVGIAPVQLDDQLTSVSPSSGHREETGVLSVGRSQLGDVDLHVGQGEPHVVEARSTGARPDDQMHDRGLALAAENSAAATPTVELAPSAT